MLALIPLLKVILTAVAGPLATELTKTVIKKTGKVPYPWVLPILSTVFGAITGTLANPVAAMTGGAVDPIVEAVMGALAGGTGSKGRDMLTGKINTVSSADKAVITENQPLG